MPYNGSGSFSPPAADFPAVALTLIESAKFNAVVNDIATGLSTAITKDGQTTITANLPMSGFRHTGVGAATAAAQYARVNEVQDGSLTYGGTAGGTADALTVTTVPTFSAYATGMRIYFKAGASPNTGAATLQANGIANAKAIQKDGSALVAADIQASKFYLAIYDGTAFQLTRISAFWPTTDGYSLISLGSGVLGQRAPVSGCGLINGYVEWSISGNALTAAVKTVAGADPSTTNPVYAWIRSSTAATAVATLAKLTAATSVTVPNTATMAVVNSQPFTLWAVLFDDGGTYRLGVIKCLVGTPPNYSIYPLAAWGIASSTTVGTGSDSSGVFYTGTGVTDKAYTTLGYAKWESGLAATGVWDAAPTREHPFTADTPLPGRVVQTVREQTGEVATGTDVTVQDDSIPQSSEGDEYIDAAITSSSAANLIEVESQFNGTNSAAGITTMIYHLHVDATADAFAAVASRLAGAGNLMPLYVAGAFLAGTTSALTVNGFCGGVAAGTTTFNGVAGARIFAGVYASFIELREVMT